MHKLQGLWRQVPHFIRRPLTFIVGMVFIIAAALTGWLPGPGGIPLFLIGIAILATEFEWAKTIRDKILVELERFGHWFKKHQTIGFNILAIFSSFVVGGLVIYFNR